MALWPFMKIKLNKKINFSEVYFIQFFSFIDKIIYLFKYKKIKTIFNAFNTQDLEINYIKAIPN